MTRNLLFVAALISFLFTSCNKDDDEIILVEGDVTYAVTFSINWNSQDFPIDYPSGAHFSRLIGWSHKSTSDFFKVGTLASEGIEAMAESGSITPLDNEITVKIANGGGLNLLLGDGLGSGVGTLIMNVDLTSEFSCITLVTMIAPSPDWFVGVINVNLLDNGKFVDQLVVNALVYDAGTDDGVSYISDNMDTQPQELISYFTDAPIGNGIEVSPAIGTVTFTKQ